MAKRWILGLILVTSVATIAGGIWGLGMVREKGLASAESTPTETNSTISPTPTPTTGTPKVALEKDPLLLDATMYAQYYGISVDEALKRFKLQGSFPGLATAIQENETDTFGGLWIQHEPEYRIVVAFTRDGDQTLRKYTAYITEEAAPYIEVRTVKYTQAVLRQAQMDFGVALMALGLHFDSGVNITENCTEFRVLESDQSKIEQAKQAGTLIIPDYVRIKYVTSLSVLD